MSLVAIAFWTVGCGWCCWLMFSSVGVVVAVCHDVVVSALRFSFVVVCMIVV